MDRLRDLIEDARMLEIEIDRDTRLLAEHLGSPLLSLANRFGLTRDDMDACRAYLMDAAAAAMARQLAEAQAEIEALDAMTFTHSERSPAAGSVSH